MDQLLAQLAIDLASSGKLPQGYKVFASPDGITIRPDGGAENKPAEEVAQAQPTAEVPQQVQAAQVPTEPTHYPPQLAMLSPHGVPQQNPYEVAAMIVGAMMRTGALQLLPQQFPQYVFPGQYIHPQAGNMLLQQLMAAQNVPPVEQTPPAPVVQAAQAPAAAPTAVPAAAPTPAPAQSEPTVQTVQPTQRRWADMAKTGVDTSAPVQKPKNLPPPAPVEKKKKTKPARAKVDKNTAAEAVASTETVPEGHVTGSCLLRTGKRSLPVCTIKHSEAECRGIIIDDDGIRVWTQCVDIHGEPIPYATDPCSGKSVHGNGAGSVPTDANFCHCVDADGKTVDSSIYGCTNPECKFNHVGAFIPENDERREFKDSFYPEKPQRQYRRKDSGEHPSRAVNGNGERARPIRAVDFIRVKIVDEPAADPADENDKSPPTIMKKSIDGMPQ